MRSTRRILVVPFALAAAAFGLGQGCQDATQATLEIRMVKSELCPKSGGTGIAVGTDRDETEQRITTYVTAETRECDPSSGMIGSLVVTPGESGKAAIVVAVAFDATRARSSSECRPPAYAGCIVARRFLAFADHKNLRLPITIDPACLDVPCNATSTCRKGNCYDSRTINGEEPGDDGKGGALEGGIVDGAADGFTPDGSRQDGSTSEGGDGSSEGGEAGGEGGDAEAGKSTVPFCLVDDPSGRNDLYCETDGFGVPKTCGIRPTVPNACCPTGSGGGTSCAPVNCVDATTQLCCRNEDCPQPGYCCPPETAKGQPRTCKAGGPAVDGNPRMVPLVISQCAAL